MRDTRWFGRFVKSLQLENTGGGKGTGLRGRASWSFRRRSTFLAVGDHVFKANPLETEAEPAFLSLLALKSEATHHFLNAANIARLPRGAIVVNAARGGEAELSYAIYPANRGCPSKLFQFRGCLQQSSAGVRRLTCRSEFLAVRKF